MKTKKIKRKKNQKKSAIAFLTVALVATVGIATGSTVVSQYKKILDLRQRQQEVQAAIEAETEKSIELENKRSYYQSDVYIEEIAREQLGLIRPDEILIINRSAP